MTGFMLKTAAAMALAMTAATPAQAQPADAAAIVRKMHQAFSLFIAAYVYSYDKTAVPVSTFTRQPHAHSKGEDKPVFAPLTPHSYPVRISPQQ